MGMGSCLVVGSAYHKITKAKVELAKGIIGDMLHSYSNSCSDCWDHQLTVAELNLLYKGTGEGGGSI
jgi:hypothetical protein